VEDRNADETYFREKEEWNRSVVEELPDSSPRYRGYEYPRVVQASPGRLVGSLDRQALPGEVIDDLRSEAHSQEHVLRRIHEGISLLQEIGLAFI